MPTWKEIVEIVSYLEEQVFRQESLRKDMIKLYGELKKAEGKKHVEVTDFMCRWEEEDGKIMFVTERGEEYELNHQFAEEVRAGRKKIEEWMGEPLGA
jgi:hypothetical protein